MYRLLDDHEVAHAVQALNQSQPDRWHTHDRALHAQWVFGSFMDAMAFMHQVAQIAEAMNHHPEWANVYDRVTVRLTTHDQGGLTDHDLALARAMNQISEAVWGAATKPATG